MPGILRLLYHQRVPSKACFCLCKINQVGIMLSVKFICLDGTIFPRELIKPLKAVLHDLSAYDAAYLELAERFNACWKTFDKVLLNLKRRYAWTH
jgi:hypothetical protein